jgi:HK97 family phage portal protein
MAWRFPSWADVAKAIGYGYEEPKQLPQVGASSAPGAATFDPHASMAAFATFPWVRACVNAIADDLSGLPLRLTRGEGANEQVIDRHPVLDLLAQPTSTSDRTMWERQLITYWLPTGTATILLVGEREPVSLPLLHPEAVVPVMDEFGMLEGVQFSPRQGAPRRYFPASSVALVSLTSWHADARSLVGEGMISALVDDLNAERGAAKLAAKQANRGRPEAIISPADKDQQLTKVQRDQIAAAYADFSASKAPAFVMSGAIKAEFPSFSLRDMEFGEQRKMTRETVLGLFGVPPTRVGLPTANYATSKQQDQVYWQGLKAHAAVIDAALTRIARRFDPSIRVAHDFSSVPAFQESRDARLDRVATWVSLGADAAEAAAYEGFADAPLAMGAADEEEVAPPAKGGGSLLHLFREVNGDDEPASTVMAVPEGEEARSKAWGDWVAKVHTPAEVKMARATMAALKRQGARVAARLETMPVQLSAGAEVRKDLALDILSWLFPADEARLWADSMRLPLRETVRAGFRDGAEQLGKDWVWSGSEAAPLTERRLAEFVTFTDQPTKDKVRAAVQEGIDAGETVNEIGIRVRGSGAFSPSRALLIARTETSRSLSGGHTAAYRRFGDETGATVKKQWLSARDSSVRDAHAFLDGQTVGVGELFRVPAGEFTGATAEGPGGFAAAGLVCNCRCTTVPVIEEAA